MNLNSLEKLQELEKVTSQEQTVDSMIVKLEHRFMLFVLGVIAREMVEREDLEELLRLHVQDSMKKELETAEALRPLFGDKAMEELTQVAARAITKVEANIREAFGLEVSSEDA